MWKVITRINKNRIKNMITINHIQEQCINAFDTQHGTVDAVFRKVKNKRYI